MKGAILWLDLPERLNSKVKGLYHSINDLPAWIERTSSKKTGEQARLYFSLLVEVNALDISVRDRLYFLNTFHPQINRLISHLAKKFSGTGLPLDELSRKYVELVNAFWSEMATGYKIVLEDIQCTGFLCNLFTHKDQLSALNMVLYYLINQNFYNYKLYSDYSHDIWRDIHKVYNFALKNGLNKKVYSVTTDEDISIENQYKKILLFSLSNPNHLSLDEMDLLWTNLDGFLKHLIIDTRQKKIAAKQMPFLINPYSDQPPLHNFNQHISSVSNLQISSSALDTLYGLDTSKLVTLLQKNKLKIKFPTPLINSLTKVWSGSNYRAGQRDELIEPISVAIGLTNVSQFLTRIDLESRILKLDADKTNDFKLEEQQELVYQAMLLDQSDNGFRIKLILQDNQRILPSMGEVIIIKNQENEIRTGYIRWLKENREGDVEFGIEHLSSMAEPVKLLIKPQTFNSDVIEYPDQGHSLASFVFPGNKSLHFKPIVFTHSFIERFTNPELQNIKLLHKTGDINITLTDKVDQILDYSLFLFEKQNLDKDKNSLSYKEKTARFESMWTKI